MKEIYRSKYEACPYLCEHLDEVQCDFEVLADEIASMTGFLKSLVKDDMLQDELLVLCELIYHAAAALRTPTTLTEIDVTKLESFVQRLEGEVGEHAKQFVLTQGGQSGALSHVLRAKCKCLVRHLYQHQHQGHTVEKNLFDFTNLLSGYFFLLALKLNELDGVDEIPYVSRHDKE